MAVEPSRKAPLLIRTSRVPPVIEATEVAAAWREGRELRSPGMMWMLGLLVARAVREGEEAGERTRAKTRLEGVVASWRINSS